MGDTHGKKKGNKGEGARNGISAPVANNHGELGIAYPRFKEKNGNKGKQRGN